MMIERNLSSTLEQAKNQKQDLYTKYELINKPVEEVKKEIVPE